MYNKPLPAKASQPVAQHAPRPVLLIVTPLIAQALAAASQPTDPSHSKV